MTTIRERVERGEREKEMIAFFWKNKGSTPLCCFETNINQKYRCGHTKPKYFPLDEFHFICLGCQEEIARILTMEKTKNVYKKLRH